MWYVGVVCECWVSGRVWYVRVGVRVGVVCEGGCEGGCGM